MTTTLTLLGAGGKMGMRITDKLAGEPGYDVRHVEPAEKGRDRLRDRDVEPAPLGEALAGTDVVVLAVPDGVIGDVCEDVVSRIDDDVLVILLDPAAAHAGVLPEREGVSYFITHPCHPSLFPEEIDAEARVSDLFGGEAVQNVVCALHVGTEADYRLGERLAREIYAPVNDVHRLTPEQMAILEPALVETLTATLLSAIRDGLERTVEMGVPEEAARDFLYGHVRTEAAIIFGEASFPLSDAAQEAVDDAMGELFVDDWEDRVFDHDRIRESVENIATPGSDG